MLHGLHARFHLGTVVCLTGAPGSTYADELCEILSYEADRRKWLVRLQHPTFAGRQLRVAEESISLVYCLLPANAAPQAVTTSTRVVEAKTSFGRGLVTLDPCRHGAVLFEETPFFLSAAGVEAAYQARWHAYLRLAVEAKEDETARLALVAFDKLSCGDPKSKRGRDLQEAAEKLANTSGYGEGQPDRADFEDAVSTIAAVLQRVQANHLDYREGHSVSALFRQGCIMNHACSPTVALTCHWVPDATGSATSEDGRLVVCAARDLDAGEALCFNYGPSELTSWSLECRRRYLLEELMFHCLCPRCVREELEEASGAVCLSSMD